MSEPQPITKWLLELQEQWKNTPESLEAVSMTDFERRERRASYNRVRPEQFAGEIDRGLLVSPAAFDRVATWDGKFPGPLAIGPTGTAKTRAAWLAMGRLYVDHRLAFDWFPVKRLLHSMKWYEDQQAGDEFFRMLLAYPVVMVDDIEKVNWDFASEVERLFSFYDWIYRHKRPCITTTNMTRKWWTVKMGEAFTRRMFDEAHEVVNFDK